ncbi:MAG: SEC-C domain-containing protein [Acidobacteriia bacterium]|nr:SEC-C domain-containing protein [Terriglobia bacterium]
MVTGVTGSQPGVSNYPTGHSPQMARGTAHRENPNSDLPPVRCMIRARHSSNPVFDSGVPTEAWSYPLTGRNDPCPCGSGKK